jgi:plasmid maintenance system killer protein
MIEGWKHKGLKELFLSGSKNGVRADMASRFRGRLDVLDAANSSQILGFQASASIRF